MKKFSKPITLRTSPDTYYIWVGGSCDYAHEERAGAAAYIMEKENRRIEEFRISELHTTEFRMLLKVMLHAMNHLPEHSKLCFLTNVAYLQNFDKTPTESTVNADLIRECIEAKQKHDSCTIKMVPYHKFKQLSETHEMAHLQMLEERVQIK